MSAQELRKAAALMREHGARGVAWESEWDGDYAADKGWLAPPVALAVADWLEHDADVHEMSQAAGGRGLRADGQTPNAFTVARAYLGGDQ